MNHKLNAEVLRDNFHKQPSEDRAIKYAGAALLAYHAGGIDQEALSDTLREVADWLVAYDEYPHALENQM